MRLGILLHLDAIIRELFIQNHTMMLRNTHICKSLLCLLLLVVAVCHDSKAAGPGKDTIDICRISKHVYTPETGGGSEATYEVDSKHRLVREVNTYYNGDGTQYRVTYMTNNYDANGFLTQRTVKSSHSVKKKYNENLITEKFTYKNGKLWKNETARIYEDPSRNSSSITENEYDGEGKLAKRQVTLSTGEVYKYGYSDGRMTNISDTKHKIVMNDKGAVTKKTTAEGAYTVFTYDADGRLTNTVNHKPNGDKQRELIYKYASSTYRVPTNPVRFKGHPSIPYQYGKRGMPIARSTSYKYDSDGTRTQTYDSVFTYEVDSRGNLKKRTWVSKSPTRTSTNVTTYTYVDCR